ncbi:LysM domain receptor-like kinase 4 [Nymphaea thermarum]|nr:LysM domain receptor-like kinase 4 [Nymphaea thermarum]
MGTSSAPLILLATVSFFLFSKVLSQQPYVGSLTTACENTNVSTSLFGYSCNGKDRSCPTFVIFRSTSPYKSVSSVATLLSSNRSKLAQVNGVSLSSIFDDKRQVIVPVSCSCTGIYYQHNSTYTIQGGDTYFSVANNTYQGLSTCQASQSQNSYPATKLPVGSEIIVPLRCACPTKQQISAGVKYLLSYLIVSGDIVDSISRRFGVTTDSTLNANGLEKDSTIFPFTTLLVPLQNEPLVSQTITPPPPPPSSTPPPNPEKKKSKTGLSVGIGVPVTVILILGLALFFFKKKKKVPSEDVIREESEERYLKREVKGDSILVDELLTGVSDLRHSLKVYKFEELQAATNNFGEVCRIQGAVFRGVFEGDIAAIKRIDGDASTEIDIVKKWNHFNLIRLSGVCFHQGYSFLVHEYAQNGSLKDWICGRDGLHLNWIQRVQIALDVASGLQYLHYYANPPFVHKDIKTSNILLDGDFRAKISNFRLARSVKGKEEEDFVLTRHVAGTRGYLAPEYLENGLISPKLDVYAYGVVILELVAGKEATESMKQALTAKLEHKSQEIADFMDPHLQSNYPTELASLVMKMVEGCLMKDPSSRPSMDEIVSSLTRMLAVSLAWKSSNTIS